MMKAMRGVAIVLAAIFVSSAAKSASFSFAASPIATETTFAIFNGNGTHVATNSRGTILAYQASTTQPATYLDQREIVSFYAGDPLSTQPVKLLDVSGPMNAPCVAATSSGEFWAAVADYVKNIVYVYRWADPSTSTTPQSWKFSSDQGQNGKWSCAYDEQRRQFYFIGTGFRLLTVDDFGVMTDQKILTQTALTHGRYYAEYPNISVGDDGYLDLAWTTVDKTYSVPQYHGIQYMQSPNGGQHWSITGSGPYIATPTTQAGPDEYGGSLVVNYFGELFNRNTFLTAMAPLKGSLYFAFMVAPKPGERCLGNPRCTIAMMKYPRHPTALSQPDVARPFRGSDYSIARAAPYLQFVERQGELFFLAAGSDTLAVYKLNQSSGMFDQVTTVDPRSDPANTCVGGMVADQANRASADILGAIAIVHTPCSAWDQTPINTRTDVLLFRMTP